MSWPTGEQFDRAGQLGTEYALAEIANGDAGPHESPLSGEWTDGMTERKIAYNVGFTQDDVESVLEDAGSAYTELGNAWEQSYFDTWRVEQDKRFEQTT